MGQLTQGQWGWELRAELEVFLFLTRVMQDPAAGMELPEQLGWRYCCVCTSGAGSLKGPCCFQHKVKLKDFLPHNCWGDRRGKGAEMKYRDLRVYTLPAPEFSLAPRVLKPYAGPTAAINISVSLWHPGVSWHRSQPWQSVCVWGGRGCSQCLPGAEHGAHGGVGLC